ncbi:borealin-2-like [Heptranchias perlo]|uniref:borealin-2-like n=1 Tax=Heptranchias perlo TaxID=212740 RepID=UPI00355A874D
MVSGIRDNKWNTPYWDNVDSVQRVLSQEAKDEKIQLFMKYFDAKTNEKIREMEQAFGKLIDMVDSVLAVHLLKMPAAIKRMKLKDFLVTGGTDQVAAAAVMADYPEEGVIATLAIKTRKTKAKALLASNSKVEPAESKRKAKSATAKYHTLPKIPQTKPKPASFSNCDKKMLLTSSPILSTKKTSVLQGAAPKRPSVGDKKSGQKAQKCSYLSPASVDKSLPFIKIPLADGQVISAVGDEVNNIDVQSLDPHALQGIQLLVTRLTALCEKAQDRSIHANSI